MWLLLVTLLLLFTLDLCGSCWCHWRLSLYHRTCDTLAAVVMFVGYCWCSRDLLHLLLIVFCFHVPVAVCVLVTVPVCVPVLLVLECLLMFLFQWVFVFLLPCWCRGGVYVCMYVCVCDVATAAAAPEMRRCHVYSPQLP